jgi:phosphomannomutase
MSIFKAYDIRGKYPEELHEELAYKIGRAFVTLTKAKEVMIGRDARTHSPLLATALARGIMDQGANVIDIGLATTPQVIAMRALKNHETAIMITASHLEAPFNGFKMYRNDGSTVNGRHGMKEMESLVTKGVFTAQPKGGITIADYTSDYAQHIMQLAPVKSKIKFVVDCSNGSVGPEIIYHKEHLHLNLVMMNSAPDGTFPHHSPDPLAANARIPIRDAILREKAHGGCVFDADADRVIFYDEQGIFIRPNSTACLIIKELLENNPGRVIAYDVLSSKAVPEVISENGGVPLRTVVGRSLLADDMVAHKALFGAEISGHMVYEEVANADATSLTMLKVIDVLTKSNKPFSELVKEFSRYHRYERDYVAPNPDATLHAIEAAFPNAKKDYLDGITLEFEDAWFVARKSNTEPVLRLRGEGTTPAAIESKFKAAEHIIIQLGGHIEYH